jgi:hypothetical protein
MKVNHYKFLATFVWLLTSNSIIVNAFGPFFYQREKCTGSQQQLALFASSSSSSSQDLVRDASVKLLWETLEERKARPVLDLSKSDDEEMLSVDGSAENTNTSTWDQGQRWLETQRRLQELGFSPQETTTEGFLLASCPQLYRLEPVDVGDTAEWLVHEFGVKYVLSQPRFLTYRLTDVQYGLEFLSTMMMLPSAKVIPACQTVPALFVSGIDGGIQERAVQEALGAAGDATYKANQRAAGDTVAALNAFKNRKPLGM